MIDYKLIFPRTISFSISY